MSELAWKWAYFPYLDAPDKQHESAVNAGYVKVVLKSEADKVIDELKQDVENWMGSFEASRRVNARAESKLRHSNYKRCLAMAEMCEARYDEEDAKVNGCGASWEYISKEMKYWERWRWRWEALAEKFKPNNEVNNG